MQRKGKEDCTQRNHQEGIGPSRGVEIPEFFRCKPQINVDRTVITPFHTLGTHDAITIVVHQKRMPEHGAARLIFITAVTDMFPASIEAEMTIGPQLKHRRHGKNCVDCPEWAEVTAPNSAFVKDAEDKGTG